MTYLNENNIRCPTCRGGVLQIDSLYKCQNNLCSKKFPVINGVPIFLNDQSKFEFPKNDSASFKKNIFNKIKSFIPSPSLNLSCKDNFRLLEKLLLQIEAPRVLVIGGAISTTGTTEFLDNYLSVESDIYIGPRTRIVFDAHSIPYENESFDLIIYQTVLEYVADPVLCIQEAYRVLKPDGLVFASTPFLQQTRVGLTDYQRYTFLGHRRLFNNFRQIESGIFAGPGVVLVWALKWFFGSFFDKKFYKNIAEFFATALFFWIKYFDLYLIKKSTCIESASGFYFIGQKQASILEETDLIAECQLMRG